MDVSLKDTVDYRCHRGQSSVAKVLPRSGAYRHHQQAEVTRAPSGGNCRPQDGPAVTRKTPPPSAESGRGGASVMWRSVAHPPCTYRSLSRSKQ